MGNNKKSDNRSRRQFFSLLFPEKNEKIKMLTADGSLVEVDKKIAELAAKQKRATNKEVYTWMKNPSKKEM